ncbi:uncharacterized protein A4U43_C05F10400 [Asparagus officinalis]|uniref:HMA domain-containing protein n=1 Tax=Asparagus officinalis TaxID=4686 RepID=A0A5P1EW33_ASPOF|nr:uncharacterized protein A4U43_C05F10400 [Asparagus officinalis]
MTNAGVISAQVDGDKIVVIGEDIDSVVLTVMLRKRMGFAELISVESADKKKEEEKKKKEEGDKKTVQTMVWPYQYPMVPSQSLIYESRDPYSDSCSIM